MFALCLRIVTGERGRSRGQHQAVKQRRPAIRRVHLECTVERGRRSGAAQGQSKDSFVCGGGGQVEEMLTARRRDRRRK